MDTLVTNVKETASTVNEKLTQMSSSTTFPSFNTTAPSTTAPTDPTSTTPAVAGASGTTINTSSAAQSRTASPVKTSTAPVIPAVAPNSSHFKVYTLCTAYKFIHTASYYYLMHVHTILYIHNIQIQDNDEESDEEVIEFLK